jgi:CheY-like chemotaxis protein
MAKILIVEDDASLVRILAHCLRNAGHTPVVAPDGHSALHAVNAKPDLILLDLGLPDLRGEQVLRRFRSRPDTAEVPVVVISGEADAASIIRQSGVNGVTAVLSKPVSGADACRVVEAVLATRTAWGAAAAGLPADRQRAKLILRLILEGSTPLVFQVCRLLDVERAGRPTDGDGDVPTWLDIARRARRECLLDDDLTDGDASAARDV